MDGRLPDLWFKGYALPLFRELVMPTVIGLDIAKHFFQLHSVDPATGEIQRSKLQRSELLAHFGNLAPSIVAMEACGSSQRLGSTIYGDGPRGATHRDEVRPTICPEQQDRCGYLGSSTASGHALRSGQE